MIRQIGREIRTLVGESVSQAVETASEDDTVLLDLIDYCLSHGKPNRDLDNDVGRLESFLKHGCLWTPLKRAHHRWTLVERVGTTAISGAEIAIDGAGTIAGTHLATAWEAAYGRHPNPSAAYEQCIKAVEAVASPIFAPKDGRATLGKVIKNITDSPDKWGSPVGLVGR